MSNMMFLLRQRAAAFLRHRTSITRYRKERIACVVIKCGQRQSEPNPQQYHLFSDKVHAIHNLSCCIAETVRNSPNFINSTLSQLDNRIQFKAKNKFPSKDDKKETITLKSLADTNLHLLQCLDTCLTHKLNGFKKVTDISPSNWMTNYNQKRSLLDGLFGNWRQDVLTLSSLGPFSYNCRGLHLVPTLYCRLPKKFDVKTVKHHPLGTTFVSDLCSESQIRLKGIAHEHLKKILRENNIKVIKNKPKKYPDKGVFKSPLLAQVERDVLFNKSINRVPSILRFFITEIVQRDLDTEGIFRVSGAATRIKVLRSNLEKNFYDSVIIDTNEYEIHDFTTLMKTYLGELPAKLISTEKFEMFPYVEELPFKSKQYNVMNYFMLSMTPEHRETLQYLLSFLEEVIRHTDKNKMGPDNIATVFSPNVFKTAELPTAELQKRYAINTKLFKAWLFYYRHLAIVPDVIMDDLRKSFSSKSAKIKFDSTLFPALKKPSVPGNVESHNDATITVLTPYESQASKEIKIGATHTARQVVCEVLGLPFDPSDDGAAAAGPTLDSADELTESASGCFFNMSGFARGDEKPVPYLYEVGGNMGERCLHPNTNLLNVYKANPKAYWIVKTIGKPPSHVSKKK